MSKGWAGAGGWSWKSHVTAKQMPDWRAGGRKRRLGGSTLDHSSLQEVWQGSTEPESAVRGVPLASVFPPPSQWPGEALGGLASRDTHGQSYSLVTDW